MAKTRESESRRPPQVWEPRSEEQFKAWLTEQVQWLGTETALGSYRYVHLDALRNAEQWACQIYDGARFREIKQILGPTPEYEMRATYEAIVESLRELLKWCTNGPVESAQRSQLGDSISVEDRALQALVVHPEWTNKEIATHIGCNVKSLSKGRSPRFYAARQAHKAANLPKGSKSAGGDIEAWDE